MIEVRRAPRVGDVYARRLSPSARVELVITLVGFNKEQDDRFDLLVSGYPDADNEI